MNDETRRREIFHNRAIFITEQEQMKTECMVYGLCVTSHITYDKHEENTIQAITILWYGFEYKRIASDWVCDWLYLKHCTRYFFGISMMLLFFLLSFRGKKKTTHSNSISFCFPFHAYFNSHTSFWVYRLFSCSLCRSCSLPIPVCVAKVMQKLCQNRLWYFVGWTVCLYLIC